MALPLLALPALLEMGGKLIDRLIPNPEAKAAATLELAKLQESGELARMADATKLTEAFLADDQSARDREVKIATSPEAPLLNKIIVPCLAIGVLVSSFALFGVLLLDEGNIEASRKDVFIYILGVLSAIDTQIIAYYFGSSAGSTAKDQTLKRMMQNGQ
jgi:hypothetical protein